jgi:hypothetical protein
VLALAIAVWLAHGGGMSNRGYSNSIAGGALGSADREPRYFVGFALWQSRDPTAIAVIGRLELPFVPSPPAEPIYQPGSVEGKRSRERLETRK